MKKTSTLSLVRNQRVSSRRTPSQHSPCESPRALTLALIRQFARISGPGLPAHPSLQSFIAN